MKRGTVSRSQNELLPVSSIFVIFKLSDEQEFAFQMTLARF